VLLAEAAYLKNKIPLTWMRQRQIKLQMREC